MTRVSSSRQVAGDHYQSSSQHWDFIRESCGFGCEYYLGCATKYVTRHRKKNGKQDLEKALHFVEKLIELAEAHVASNQNRRAFPATAVSRFAVEEYCIANGLSPRGQDTAALMALFTAGHIDHYRYAAQLISEVTERHYPAEEPAAAPEKTVGGDTIPVMYDPPKPPPGFVWEGQSGKTEFWQCMRCGEHVVAAENVPPASVHACSNGK